MGALIGWELKKILNRKVLWVAAALGLALLAWTYLGVVHNAVSGYARGWHDTYAKYEGQVATEALRQRMREDFSGYVAAHPDEFQETSRDEQTGEVHYFATDSGYNYGVSDAYNWLNQAWTQEYIQQRYQDAEQALESGVDKDGSPLDYNSTRFYERTARNGVWTPVIYDALVWEQYFYQFGSALPGPLALAVVALAMLGLFNGEAAARMEAVVLTVKARRRLAAAKLLAGGVLAVAVTAFYFALSLGLYLWAYGTAGADAPARMVFSAMDATNLTTLPVGLLVLLTKALAVVACASAVAWASARFHNPLLTLLAAAAALAVMMVGFVGLAIPEYYNWPILVNFIVFAKQLPLSVVLSDMIYDVTKPLLLVCSLAFPVALSGLLCWFARHAFLSRRKV